MLSESIFSTKIMDRRIKPAICNKASQEKGSQRGSTARVPLKPSRLRSMHIPASGKSCNEFSNDGEHFIKNKRNNLWNTTLGFRQMIWKHWNTLVCVWAFLRAQITCFKQELFYSLISILGEFEPTQKYSYCKQKAKRIWIFFFF